MSDVELTNKRFCIFGIQGTGKSVLSKYIIRHTNNSIVYDVLNEYQGLNRYIVTHRQVKRNYYADPAVVELNSFVNRVVRGSGQVRMFVLEEANRFCPPKPNPLPASILDLNDFQRHDKIAFGSVARRPVQLNSDLVELAHYLFIFNLVGKNDTQYLESIAEGLGEAVKALPEYHFMVVPPRRQDYYIHEPVPYE